MDKDEVAKDWLSSIETNSSENNSKDSIPDAKYYLVRPEDSSMVYLMVDKPDYPRDPFYKATKGEFVEDYLNDNAEFTFDSDTLESDIIDALDAMDLYPDENEVKYLFASTQEVSEKDLPSLLSKYSYCVDEIIAKHYELHNWHIEALLQKSPFKEYIKEHYFTEPKCKVKPKEVPEEIVHERAKFLQNEINKLNKKRLLL